MKGKAILFNSLGILCIIASIGLTVKLLIDGLLLTFWSKEWSFGVAGVFILSLIAIVLLHKEKTGRTILGIYGILHSLVALACLIHLGLNQIIKNEAVPVWDYVGFLLLIAVTGITTIGTWDSMNPYYKTIFLWILGVINLGLFGAMLYAYVFNDKEIVLGSFIGEVAAIVFGLIAFVKMYQLESPKSNTLE